MWKVMLWDECYGMHDNEKDARANFEMRLAPRPDATYAFTLVHPGGRRETAESAKVGGKK